MKAKYVLAIATVLLLGIVCYKIEFVATSLRMQSRPENVFASSSSPITVKATLVNRLGLPVPFERLVGKFVIYRGADKINVIKKESDTLVFKTTGDTGRLVIFFYSTAMPFPVEMVLNIRESAMATLLPPMSSTRA